MDIQVEKTGEKKKGKNKKALAMYDTKKEPRKSLNTFFRNQNKFLMGSLAIADRKAMIMIRINTTIVSGIIVFFSFLKDSVDHGLLLGAILMFGCGSALIFSILAAKPNTNFLRGMFKKVIFPRYPDLEYNNFVPFARPNLKEYEESMDKVVKSQSLQVGNQVRFNYVIEKYLSQKYFLLDIAYNFFLGSFVTVTVISLGHKLWHVFGGVH